MVTTEISGVMYANMIEYGVRNLNRYVEKVNNLNVFPIPDGDTGDNMMMTLQGGANAKVEEGDDLSKAGKSIAKGMLLSARGNSGVILSQFFAGISDGFSNLETADTKAYGNAFKQGVKRAYSSVMQPTEGTILTVAKDATNAACAGSHKDIEGFMEAFVAAAKESLRRTPELLAVLKEAGVVDSGGAGLIYIAEGMLSYLKGDSIEGEAKSSTQKTQAIDIESFGPDSILEFGYCTELLLRLQSSKVDVESFDVETIKSYLAQIGNSIVCIKTDSIVKLHVHTMTPHVVLQFCQQYGEFLTIKIENMMLQHNEVVSREEKAQAEQEEDFTYYEKDTSERKQYAIVTVASGEGIKEAFTDLGADKVIYGGQTMNPSAEDFIKAFDEVNADDIFVLPNNGNIILAAEQAGKIYESSRIHVIPTKTIGDAYAVLAMMDLTSDDAEEIAEMMTESKEGVLTAEITYSIRDTHMNGIDVKKGDYISVFGKEIAAAESDILETAKKTLDKMDLDEHGVLLIIRGKDGSEEMSEQIADYVRKTHKYLDVNETDGGQDVYPFILVAE